VEKSKERGKKTKKLLFSSERLNWKKKEDLTPLSNLRGGLCFRHILTPRRRVDTEISRLNPHSNLQVNVSHFILRKKRVETAADQYGRG